MASETIQIQGCYFSRPLPAAEIEPLIALGFLPRSGDGVGPRSRRPASR